jgi:hypothetical protein
LLVLVLLAFNAACTGYGAPSEVINGTAVLTAEATTPTDFTSYKTFTVTDKIQVQDNTNNVPINYQGDATPIIPKFQSNMESRGYTFIPFAPGVQADLVIGLYVYLGSATYGSIYCGWYYWGYPYGCYPTYGYVGSYTYGTLVAHMGDLKNAPPMPPPTGAQLAVVWSAAIYGVLGTQQYNVQRVQAGIDQAFAQSPYIHR